MRGTIRLSVLRYWQRGRRSVAWALGKILVLTQCLPIQKGDPRPWYNGELYTQHRRGTRTNPPAVTSVWASWMSGVPFTHRQKEHIYTPDTTSPHVPASSSVRLLYDTYAKRFLFDLRAALFRQPVHKTTGHPQPESCHKSVKGDR